MTLLQQTHLIRADHPGWTFDRAWQQACALQKVTGSFGRPTKSGDSVLIAEAKDKALLPPSPPKVFLVKGSHVGWAFDIHTGKCAA
jgi:hypothetical protein